MKNYFDTNDEEKIHQFTHNLAPQAVEMIQKAQLAEELRNQANTCIKKMIQIITISFFSHPDGNFIGNSHGVGIKFIVQ